MFVYWENSFPTRSDKGALIRETVSIVMVAPKDVIVVVRRIKVLPERKQLIHGRLLSRLRRQLNDVGS